MELKGVFHCLAKHPAQTLNIDIEFHMSNDNLNGIVFALLNPSQPDNRSFNLTPLLFVISFLI